MDAIYENDYIVNDIPILDIPNNIYYDVLFNQTHNYIVNNLNYNTIYYEPTLSALQYFSIMSFLDEIS